MTGQVRTLEELKQAIKRRIYANEVLKSELYGEESKRDIDRYNADTEFCRQILAEIKWYETGER